MSSVDILEILTDAHELITNLIYVAVGRLNPYEIMPPQEIQPMRIPLEQRLARQNHFTDVLPLFMRSYVNIFTYPTSPFLVARKWNTTHFSWNQLVAIHRHT